MYLQNYNFIVKKILSFTWDCKQVSNHSHQESHQSRNIICKKNYNFIEKSYKKIKVNCIQKFNFRLMLKVFLY